VSKTPAWRRGLAGGGKKQTAGEGENWFPASTDPSVCGTTEEVYTVEFLYARGRERVIVGQEKVKRGKVPKQFQVRSHPPWDPQTVAEK